MLDKEILDGFKEETSLLLAETQKIIESIEDTEDQVPKQLIEDFANRMDRIMGAAKTFEMMDPEMKIFVQIGKFGELCKATGYKAATINRPALVPIFAAFWADTNDMMIQLCANVDDTAKIDESLKTLSPLLQKRLTWLAEQIVKLTKDSPDATAINVDGILKRMGLM